MRWFLKEGVERNSLEALPAGILDNIDETLQRSDQDLEPLVRCFKHGNLASELPMPIVNSVLGAPMSAKLTADEVKSLIDVRWQSLLLDAETRMLNEFFRLTFSVSVENHEVVIQNHIGSLRAYGRRASHMLSYVRLSLKVFQ